MDVNEKYIPVFLRFPRLVTPESVERRPCVAPSWMSMGMTGAVALLASDDAKGVHGAILLVDDGWCA